MSSRPQYRADYAIGNGGKNTILRLDSDPDHDPDGLPAAIRVVGGLVRNAGSEYLRLVGDDLSPYIAPHMISTFDNSISVYAMSESGDLFSSVDQFDKCNDIEGFIINNRGGVLSGFEFKGAKFESHSLISVGLYTLEELVYSYPPSAINIPDADKRRGKRVHLVA